MGIFKRVIDGIKSVIPIAMDGDPSNNNDFSSFRGIFANAFSSWSSSFDANRAYRFYDQARPLASTIDRISDGFSELEPALFDRETNEWITAESDVPEAEVLKFLSNPGFGQTYRQLAGDLAVSFLLTRDAFFIMHGNINFAPNAIAVAKPFYVDEREGADGYVEEYRFSKATGRMQQALFKRLKPSIFRYTSGNLLEIYHILGKTRDDGLRGRSPISALFWDLLQNVQGGQHNASMLKNGMRPSGAFVAQGEDVLTDDQFGRLKEQMQEQYTGAMNAGRPLVLDGGMKYENFIVTNKDMDYVALSTMSAEAVSDRYKVPLALVSKESMTMDNYKFAIISMFDDAVEPLAKTIFEGIEKATFERFDIDANRFNLRANPKSINAAILRTSEKMKLMKETQSFTQNEIRAESGTEAIDGGDTLYVPTNQIAVGEDEIITNPKSEKAALIKTLRLGGASQKAAQDTADKMYGNQSTD